MRCKLQFLLFFIFLVSSLFGVSPQYTLTRPVQRNKISKSLQHEIARYGDSTSFSYWVSFADKGIFTQKAYANELDKLQTQFPKRTIQRRAKVKSTSPLLDFLDIPVNKQYIDKLKQLGIKIRTVSRWFNTVGISANQQQIRQIAQYPFVVSIEPIESYHQQFPLQDTESTTMLHIKHQTKSNQKEYNRPN